MIVQQSIVVIDVSLKVPRIEENQIIKHKKTIKDKELYSNVHRNSSALAKGIIK